MGIQGLIPLLKEAHTTTHIQDYAGLTLAVDAYVWLHRGAYACAQELATGQPTLKYLNYALEKIRMLRHYDVVPYIVFDGAALPSKLGTEVEREKRRNEALAKGNAFLAAGNATQAREAFVKAVDVTPAMAYQLIKALKRENVQYVVAPYEADPQLAYLERAGIVDGIITEDSDLLVFGCKLILFKLDRDGACLEIRRENFGVCREVNFAGWTDKEFRQMAILSGCDYLDSIVGIGLKKAHGLVKKYKTVEKVIQSIRLDGQYKVPLDYPAEFRRAELTFCHQHVFDPTTQFLVHLEPLPPGMTENDIPFVGALMDVEYARGIALGEIDPLTKLAIVDLNPDSSSNLFDKSTSYYAKPTKKKVLSPAKGASSLLSYFSKAPVASTSTTRPSATVTLITAITPQKVVPIVKALKSKFFGGKIEVVQDAKGKGKEVDMLEEECMNEENDSGFFEEDGFAMEDVKMEPPPVCPSSHAGIISSPVSTPPAAKQGPHRHPSTSPRKPKFRRRLNQKSSVSFLSEPSNDHVDLDIDISAAPLSDFDGISSPVSFDQPVKIEKVKIKLEKSFKGKGKRSEGEMSDPIDCASSDVGVGEESGRFGAGAKGNGSPRGLKRRRDTKVGLPRAKVQIIEFVDGGKAVGMKGKGKGKAAKVEVVGKAKKVAEDKAELKPATQLITASWRDAFMLKPTSNKMNKAKPPAPRLAPPPSPSPIPSPSPEQLVGSFETTPTKKKPSQTRIPLSPLTNRRPSKPSESISGFSSRSSSSSQVEGVEISNEKLLAFRYGGIMAGGSQ